MTNKELEFRIDFIAFLVIVTFGMTLTMFLNMVGIFK